MEITKQVNNCRFIKVRPDTKAPLETGWNKFNNYSFNDNRLLKWIEDNKIYGVATGFNDVIVIDSDINLTERIVEKFLPKTFKVRTPSGGSHHYFKIKGFGKTKLLKHHFLKDSKGAPIHIGEIRGNSSQVVGPGSFNSKKRKFYKVENDIPIMEITKEKVEEVFKRFILNTPTKSKSGRISLIREAISKHIKVPELMAKYGFDISKNPTACLWHDCKGNGNFTYDDEQWYCFTKDTPIFTTNGIKKIQELTKKDLIIGIDGKPKKITYTFKRKIKENIYKLKISPQNIYNITGEHPLMISSKKWNKTFSIPKWKEVKDIICKNDYLVVPKTFGNLNKISLKKYKKYKNNLKVKVPDTIKVDSEFGELVGWYLAEGHIFNREGKYPLINYTLNYDEYEIGLRICNLYKKIFNISPNINRYKKRGTTMIQVSSCILGRFFIDNFKTGSKNKCLGKFINSPKIFLKSCFEAYKNGDGYEDKRRVYIASTSENLLREMQFIGYKLGIVSRICKFNNLEKGIGKNDLFNLYWHKKKYLHPQAKDYTLIKIDSIDKNLREEEVYNLETEGHQYLVPFIAHNCFHCLKGGGIVELFAELENLTAEEAKIILYQEISKKRFKN